MALFVIDLLITHFVRLVFQVFSYCLHFFFVPEDLFVARAVFVSVDSHDVRSFNLRRPRELFRKTISLRELGRYATMSPRT